MISLITILLGIESLLLITTVFTYEKKLKKLNNDYDELDAEFNEIYSAYCNTSELARQYQELAAKAADSAELYKEAYESEHNAIHYELDKNEELEAEIQSLRNALITGESKDMQYEFSGWHTDPWVSFKQPLTKDEWQNKWNGQQETEVIKINSDPYVNPWSRPNANPIYGHTPYNQNWNLKNNQTDLFETMENFE